MKQKFMKDLGLEFNDETEDLLKEFNLNGYLDQVSDNREKKDLREENNKEDNNK